MKTSLKSTLIVLILLLLAIPCGAIDISPIAQVIDNPLYPGSSGWNNYAFGINNNTNVQVVGASWKDTDAYGFRYNSGNNTWTAIQYPGNNNTTVVGINGSDVMVGYYVTNDAIQHAFMFNGSNYSTIDVTGATYGSSANGVSGSTIVGTYYTGTSLQNQIANGFVYDGTNVTTLNLNNADQTNILGINASGVMVGSYLRNGMWHGFFGTSASQYTNVDIPGAVGGTFLNGINANGVMVGVYNDASNNSYGFIYYNTYYDLITYGSYVAALNGINDNNQISGYYNVSDDPNGILHAFYTTEGVPPPTPLPASVLLFGSGLVGLIGLHRRIRRR